MNTIKNNIPISPEFRAIWKDLDKISEAAQFLGKHHIVTETDFHDYENQIEIARQQAEEISSLITQQQNRLDEIEAEKQAAAAAAAAGPLPVQCLPPHLPKVFPLRPVRRGVPGSPQTPCSWCCPSRGSPPN